jgi:hypothetical protein
MPLTVDALTYERSRCRLQLRLCSTPGGASTWSWMLFMINAALRDACESVVTVAFSHGACLVVLFCSVPSTLLSSMALRSECTIILCLVYEIALFVALVIRSPKTYYESMWSSSGWGSSVTSVSQVRTWRRGVRAQSYLFIFSGRCRSLCCRIVLKVISHD